MRAALLLFAIALAPAACRAPTARDALDAYRQAVERGDTDAIWELSDDTFRRSYSKQDLRTYLESVPEERAAWLRALGGATTGEREVHEVRLQNGRLMRMVREGEGWRVLSGGLEPVKLSSPELALAAFFAAIDSGRFELIRRLMPARLAEQLAGDDALRAHLHSVESRIAEARSRLATQGQLAVEVEGERARMVYAPGRSVRFVREKGDWKVLDLE